MSSKRYGIPYKGSKNKIAFKIIDFLPSGEVFVDLFAGGCAITHAAIEQCEGLFPKWKYIIANDIDPFPIQLFLNGIKGKYTPENRKQWISREDFFRLKDKDPYVRYCWSFGNNGLDYMYSRKIEPWKRALHSAYLLNDFTLIEEITGAIPEMGKQNLSTWIQKNEAFIKAKYRDWCYNNQYILYCKTNDDLRNLQKLQDLENVQRLQSLQSLQNIETRNLETCFYDYRSVNIPSNAVVYCDIPYQGTNCGIYKGFDHEAFFDWACSQKALVYISSYQIDDPRFKCVYEIPKRSNSVAGGNGKLVVERIYRPK